MCESGAHDHEMPSLETESDDIAPVVAFWQELGLPGLIDVHTHFMPQRVMDKVWKYFDDAGPLIGRPWPINYRHDEEIRLGRLRGYGVRAFTSLIYPHKPGMAAWLNQWAVEFARDKPDCLQTATLYPETGVGDYVHDAVEAGARVFKAHVQVGDYNPSDPLLDPAWGMIANAGIPVVIHCGSAPVSGRFTTTEPITQLLTKHPNLQLIIAHMGMGDYRAFLDLAERFPTISFDTAMAFTAFGNDMAPFPADERNRLADLGDRIMLGTDFPTIPYSYATALHALRALDLGDDWLRAVCFENAAKRFNLM